MAGRPHCPGEGERTYGMEAHRGFMVGFSGLLFFVHLFGGGGALCSSYYLVGIISRLLENVINMYINT